MPRLMRARDGLCQCQRGLQGRAFRAGYQEAEGQLAFLDLDGPGTPERPPAEGDVLCSRKPASARGCRSVECRRLSTSDRNAGQLRWPCSRARASWAAARLGRSDTARSRAIASGSPAAAARSSSRALRRSWSMSARSGRSGMMSPRSPGPRSGSSRRRRWWKPQTNREADSSPSREPGGTLSSLARDRTRAAETKATATASPEVNASTSRSVPGNPAALCLNNRPRRDASEPPCVTNRLRRSVTDPPRPRTLPGRSRGCSAGRLSRGG